MRNRKNLLVAMLLALFALPSLHAKNIAEDNIEHLYIKDTYILSRFGSIYAPRLGFVTWLTEHSDGTVSYRNPVPLMRDFSIKGIIESQENGLKRYRFTFPQEIDRNEYGGECAEEASSFRVLKRGKYHFSDTSDPEICDETVELILDEDIDGNLNPSFTNVPLFNWTPDYWLCVTDKDGNLVNYQASYDLKFYPFEPKITHLPEDAKVEIWKSNITEDYSSCGIYKDMEVEVAIYDDDLYLRFIGWSGIDPEFNIDGAEPGHNWVKGKIEDGMVVFEPGQHVGVTPYGQLCSMHLGFCGDESDPHPLWQAVFYNQRDLPIILEYSDNELKSADQKWIINNTQKAGIIISEGDMGCQGHWNSFRNFVLTPKEAVVEEFVIEPSQYSDKCFDLMGREIENPRKGTIYIQNGKKYVAR